MAIYPSVVCSLASPIPHISSQCGSFRAVETAVLRTFLVSRTGVARAHSFESQSKSHFVFPQRFEAFREQRISSVPFRGRPLRTRAFPEGMMTTLPSWWSWGGASQVEPGVPEEILEDKNFVPINDEDPRFGPPALLLLGFSEEDVPKVNQLLADMDGGFLKVLLGTEEMVKGSLSNALNSSQPDLSKVKAAKGIPQICFLSGLTGEELMMLVQAFPQAGFRGTVFAAHVPLNSQKPLEQLIEEIMGDHERLSKRREPAQA